MSSVRGCALGLALSLALAAGCGRIGYAPIELVGVDGAVRDAGALDAARSSDGASNDVGVTDAASDAEVPLDAGPEPGVDGGSGFDAGACTESPCRLAPPQCGCPPEQACTFVAPAMIGCLTPGTHLGGETCTTSADCARGLNCTHFGGRTPPGVCTPFCATAADCTVGSTCTELAPPVSGVGLCSIRCNAVTQTGCPATLACYVFPVLSVPGGTGALASTCTTASGFAEGAPCTRPRDCGPGLTCVMVGPSTVCAPQCVVGGGACVSGTCTGYATPLTIFGIEYGVCV